MNLDELPDQLEAFFDRAQVVLDRQITEARKAVDALNAEKTGAEKALAELKDQHKQVQSELDAVLKDLGRVSSLVGLNAENRNSPQDA